MLGVMASSGPRQIGQVYLLAWLPCAGRMSHQRAVVPQSCQADWPPMRPSVRTVHALVAAIVPLDDLETARREAGEEPGMHASFARTPPQPAFVTVTVTGGVRIP